jgi:hypothetical protein
MEVRNFFLLTHRYIWTGKRSQPLPIPKLRSRKGFDTLDLKEAKASLDTPAP